MNRQPYKSVAREYARFYNASLSTVWRWRKANAPLDNVLRFRAWLEICRRQRPKGIRFENPLPPESKALIMGRNDKARWALLKTRKQNSESIPNN